VKSDDLQFHASERFPSRANQLEAETEASEIRKRRLIRRQTAEGRGRSRKRIRLSSFAFDRVAS
jgi:hypothetical protein